MKIYKDFLKTVVVFCLAIVPALACAVTQKEMEQARAIAAKAYIRYANDGSGYLDDINASSIEELEAQLKPKEKENIKAFKAIPVPSDYASWNKEKLVEYWAVTAFQNKGLLEKGRGGRIRARTQINKMNISAPQASGVASAAPAPAAAIQGAPADSLDNPKTMAEELAAAEDALTDEALDEGTQNMDKVDNNTWVYIMILGILVAIVIVLVVYAGNVLKRNGREARHSAQGREEDENYERYESVISEKDVEIAMLNKKLESATRQNSELKAKIEALTAQIAALGNKQAAETPVHEKASDGEEKTVARKPTLRSIFLGRANAKGIFVRADRTLNPGHSVYSLDTSDGYSGTFRIADSREAWKLALSNPREYLMTACTGHDLEDTDGATRIVTEASGTAIFEGGCWRVIRKAKIRYE